MRAPNRRRHTLLVTMRAIEAKRGYSAIPSPAYHRGALNGNSVTHQTARRDGEQTSASDVYARAERECTIRLVSCRSVTAQGLTNPLFFISIYMLYGCRQQRRDALRFDCNRHEYFHCHVDPIGSCDTAPLAEHILPRLWSHLFRDTTIRMP